jgi:hypothetical protein
MELLELHSALWHLAFVTLVTQRKPPNFEVFSEVRLSIEPQRADMILLRRKDMERLDHEATVLLRLWAWLRMYTVLEYKSPVNYAFKPGDLQRLYMYGLLWDMNHRDELPTPDELTLVLAVASLTPTFFDELARMGLTLVPLGGGYGRIDGMMYTCYVVITDDVCEEERDDYLRIFSHHDTVSGEATEWARFWMREARMSGKNVEDLAGFDEWWQSLQERTMRKILVKELGKFDPEHLIIGLPLAILRGLKEDYIRTLTPDVQDKIRQRLREEAH